MIKKKKKKQCFVWLSPRMCLFVSVGILVDKIRYMLQKNSTGKIPSLDSSPFVYSYIYI